jgi:hypothetical protein
VAVGAALQGAIIANQGIIPGAEQRELVLLDGKFLLVLSLLSFIPLRPSPKLTQD